ncbi:hypothetical protein [Kosakonia sp. YIM B13611]|uniref:hypothetical protein n=1 Tax=unclassified Kosakonia TaxID=2632876 RepID=UPI0036B67811
MAESNFTTFVYNGQTYELAYGGWLNHRYSEASEAAFEVYTDDIHLSDNMTIGAYKAIKRSEYQNIEDKRDITFTKYLKQSFKTEFGMEWDEAIKGTKKAINDSCLPYILRQKSESSADERWRVLYQAAMNGHVVSTYFIATSMSDGEDDGCLDWLALAHNREHIGAAYDMAAYFYRKGNILDALRCLIISADGGFDIAYMTLFNIELLKKILCIQDRSKFDAMLKELIGGSHSSCARYFKAVELLAGDSPGEGIALLKKFRQTPKKKPAEKDIDDTYRIQVAFTEEFLDTALIDMCSQKPPLVALMDCSLKFSDPHRGEVGKQCSLSFEAFRDSIEMIRTMLVNTEV